MMQIGVLWTTEGKALEQVVPVAAARCAVRLNVVADRAFVHPSALPDGERMVDGVLVAASARVLRGHLWIGREGEPDPGCGGVEQLSMF